MKKSILLLCIASMLLSLGYSALADSSVPYISMTFDTEDLSGINATVSSDDSSVSSVNASDGRLNLTANGAMKFARASLTQKITVADSPVIYFDFLSQSAKSIQSFGILSGTAEKNIFTIMNNAVSVNSANVYTLNPDNIYRAAVSFNGGKVYIAINNEIVYDGTLTALSGITEGNIFFKNISLGAESKLSADNITVTDSGDYAPKTNIENEQILQSFEKFTASFGTPILKADGMLKCDGTAIDTKLSFTYNSVTLTSSAAFETSKQYEAVVTNIYTADGIPQEDISIKFMLAPEGYIAPIVTAEPLNEVYRPGDEITVAYNVESNNTVTKTVLIVNGIVQEEKNDLTPFTISLAEGIYRIAVAAYDNIGGSGKSPEQVISVKENTPPEIEFLEIAGNSADVSLLDNFKIKITDDVFVGDVELYINGESVNPSVTVEGDTYIFSKFNYYLGTYPVTVKAYDLEGGENEVTKNITVSKSLASVLTENNFEDGASNTGFNVISQGVSEYSNVTVKDNSGNNTKAFTIKRTAAEPKSAPYITRIINGSGIYTLEFDVMLPSLGAAVQINTRGKGATEYPLNVVSSGANIILKNGSASITKSNVLTAGKWHNFRYVCDVNSFMYWFYLDGEMLTPAEGYAFASSFAEQALADLRIQFSLALNDSAYIDNIKWEQMFNYPSILSGTVVPGGSITLNLASSIDAGSVVSKDLPKNITVYADGKPIDFYKAEASGSEIKLYSQELYSDVSYKAVLSKNATFSGGVQLGTDAFIEIPADTSGLNISDVRFASVPDGKLNIEADVQNNEDTNTGFYAVIALVNSKGAVEKIISSGKFELSPYSSETFSINGIEANGSKAEVMFIRSWAECEAVTNRIYKQQ